MLVTHIHLDSYMWKGLSCVADNHVEETFMHGSYSGVEGTFTCGSYSCVEGAFTFGSGIHIWELLMWKAHTWKGHSLVGVTQV